MNLCGYLLEEMLFVGHFTVRKNCYGLNWSDLTDN